jgi:hypothetical protein
MMIANNGRPRWFFYLGWVVLNIIAVVIAWYITRAIISQVTNIVGDRIQVGGQSRITEDFLFVYLLLPIIGLLTGFIQYTLLRQHLPRMAWWIAATFLGWLTPFVTSFFITAFFTPNNGTFSIMLGMLLIGAAVALPQWWMLRQRVHHASWWILAYGFSWWMMGSLSLVTSETFIVVLAVALTPTIFTGIACWLLLDWLPNHEEKSSLSSY